MRFSYTSNLRQYDGGIIDVGHYSTVSQLIVPPHRREFEIEGGCGAACIGGVRGGLSTGTSFFVLLTLF